jgi:membrane-associated phospholipid phosphatase
VRKLNLKYILIFFCLISTRLYCQNIDIDLLRYINLDNSGSMDGTWKVISASASPVALGTPLVMCLTGVLNHDSVTLRKSLYVGTSVAVTIVLTSITKYVVNRPRPYETYPDIEKKGNGGSPSFPSGHTSEAFALATSVSLSYPKWYIIAPSFVWAGAVGYSRMYLGVHYPSDVLAGAVLGTGCSWITFKVNQKLNRNNLNHKHAAK